MHSAAVNRLVKTTGKLLILVAGFVLGIAAIAAPLDAQVPRTTEAFNQYIAAAEARITHERNSTFLKIDASSPAEKTEFVGRLKRGEVVIEKEGNGTTDIPGGLIHDWVGTVLIPNTTVAPVIALIRDYNHTASYYSPDVMASRLISTNGDGLHVFMRLRKHKVITVVLDTEYDVQYGQIDATHQYSNSRSTRISEIENPGEANEHALPAGHDHGFMWRLNSYWSFEQADGGVIVKCEAISLTRDIPTGLAWMVGPFVNSIPRESLEFTLSATRAAFVGKSLGSGKQD